MPISRFFRRPSSDRGRLHARWVIGLDAAFRTRASEKVMTLTSIAAEVIDAKAGLTNLMACRSTALYIAWLLGRRQRHSDRLLAANSSLDPRGRLATMVLHFYTRLSRQKRTTGLSYQLPLTQMQIAAYLGLSVAHVNRVLWSLRDGQIVNFERHCLTILDLKQLEKLAGVTARSPDRRDVALSNQFTETTPRGHT